MAREIFLGPSRLRLMLDPSLILGEGGEAEVYDVSTLVAGVSSCAVKIWKDPDHPSYAGSDADSVRNRQAAAQRLTDYAQKVKAFPSTLPARVITPREIALTRHDRTVGYSMLLLRDSYPLRKLKFRQHKQSMGIDAASVVKIFKDLHATVADIHRKGVVIGDFNYLNVLVQNQDPYIIDADSFQFGKFQCRSFTTHFVDPLVCDPHERVPLLVKAHSPDTDWYAYALMLFEILMEVGAYDGIYKPKNAALQIAHDARPLKRISVFHPEVGYPKSAVPLHWLPAQAVDHFGAIFSKDDRRGVFPAALLEILEAHALGKYVDPSTVITPARLTEVIRGNVRTKRIHSFGSSVIIQASLQDGKLRLIRHDGSDYLREDGTVALKGKSSRDYKFRLSRGRTLASKGSMLALLDPLEAQPVKHSVDLYRGMRSVFDANSSHYYWVEAGILYRDEGIGQKLIGKVLKNQTMFWVGPKFGFGFYRAAGINVGFVFDAHSSGINDSVELPPMKGEFVDAACYFSSNRAWFLWTMNDAGNLTNHCVAIGPDGKVSEKAQAPEGDGSWLGTIRGKCAATVEDSSSPGTGGITHRLFAATDDGLVAIDERGGKVSERARYPDTRDFVDPSDRIFYAGKNELLVVSRSEVWQVALG